MTGSLGRKESGMPLCTAGEVSVLVAISCFEQMSFDKTMILGRRQKYLCSQVEGYNDVFID